MSTLRNYVSTVRSSFKLNSIDELVSDRYIASELQNTALKYIKQQTDKRKLFASPNIFTELPCIEMIQVPLAECCSYTSPCMIARSKNVLPKIVDNLYGLIIQGVYSLDKRVSFLQSNPRRYANSLELGLPDKRKFFWFLNGYLYITDPLIESCTLDAFFENVVDVSLYSCNNKQSCPANPLDLEFKVPPNIMDDVIKEVYNKIKATYKQSVEDPESDDKDESK